MTEKSMNNRTCSFCNIIKNNLNNKLFNQILYENDRFVIIPSIGPFTVGHVLVVPKIHIISLFNSPVDIINDYQVFINDITSKMAIFSAELLEIEHGSTNTINAGASIQHSHIHLIPGYGFLENILEDKFKVIKSKNNIIGLSRINKPYVYIRGSTRISKLYLVGALPQQYMRKVLFNQYGRNDWNWKKYPNLNIIKKTIDIFKNGN